MNIDQVLNLLFQKQFSTREQLLKEVLRVKMTLKALLAHPHDQEDKGKLFQLMKKVTEGELGFFPADRDDFFELFEAIKEIDLIEIVLKIYQDDRTGTVISPEYLNHYIAKRIKLLKPETILITEAEKHLINLKEMLKQFKEINFTLTTQYKPMQILLELAFGDEENVNIRFASIYTRFSTKDKFDYIYSLPAFGLRVEDLSQQFLTKDSDGIALENLLNYLGEDSTLDIILPAKITFAGLDYEKLRSYISANYFIESIYILPEGTFRPTTAIKTYLFSIRSKKREQIKLGMLEFNRKALMVKDEKTITAKELLAHDDWRVELLLADDDANIQQFKNSHIPKVKLKEVAEVFRGKSVLKKDLVPGDIFVLNISNIEKGEINYQEMDTIDEEERKIKRYELETDDVVLSCRGTIVKSAVFQKQENTIIASANLIVIRPRGRMEGGFVKIFFESPIGMAMIKSFQRGTTVMNINYADIMEMEIPLLPLGKQQEIISHYQEELEIYQETIKQGENRWAKVKKDIYGELI